MSFGRSDGSVFSPVLRRFRRPASKPHGRAPKQRHLWPARHAMPRIVKKIMCDAGQQETPGEAHAKCQCEQLKAHRNCSMIVQTSSRALLTASGKSLAAALVPAGFDSAPVRYCVSQIAHAAPLQLDGGKGGSCFPKEAIHYWPGSHHSKRSAWLPWHEAAMTSIRIVGGNDSSCALQARLRVWHSALQPKGQ